MSKDSLLEERIELFRSAAAFTAGKRVPYFSSAVTWKIFDAGQTLDSALTDFSVMEQCVRRFLDTYPVDGLLDYGIRNQFGVMKAFGSDGYYYYTDDAVGVHDHAHCTCETLLSYLEQPEQYIWETILPEKFGEAWQSKDLSVWKNTFRAYMDYTKFIIHIGSVVKKEYHIPSMAPNNPMKGAISFGIEELLANLLGIKQLSVAMRRNADILDEFISRWDREHIDPLIEKIKKNKGPDRNYCFDASIMMLAQNVLNPKQFERWYWPSLERLLDAYCEKGMNVRIFAEGSILRYSEYFSKYPKGVLTFHLEQDDPVAFRQALPNCAIMGGLTTDLLANGTTEECISRARYLMDTLGTGLILSENKMLSYRNDCRAENLKAVTDMVAGGNSHE